MFPTSLRSTAMNEFRVCPTKFNWSVLKSLRRKGTAIDLIAGAAFAKGLEVARKHYFLHKQPARDSIDEGILAAIKEYGDVEPPTEYKRNKAWHRVAAGLDYYLTEAFPLDSDYLEPYQPFPDLATIEFDFAVDFPFPHPETGEPIILTGRCDMVARFKGTLFVEDDKTTGSISKTWVDDWQLRGQFLQYVWAARRCGIPVEGVIVRGLGMYVASFSKAEAIIQFQDWELDRWEQQTYRNLERMVASWRAGEWDQALGDACTSYSGCPFRLLCMKKDPQPWIESEYETAF